MIFFNLSRDLEREAREGVSVDGRFTLGASEC
jgi:hypothetical protein